MELHPDPKLAEQDPYGPDARQQDKLQLHQQCNDLRKANHAREHRNVIRMLETPRWRRWLIRRLT